MGDRYDGIKKIAYLITGIVHNPADTIDNFNFIFTKYSDKDLESMHGILKNMLDCMSEQDKAFEPYKRLIENIFD
jgi:hypothetical protein